MSTRTRFEKEAKGYSEMAYCAGKSTQIVLADLKKCLKFRIGARELLTTFNYSLADNYKYS